MVQSSSQTLGSVTGVYPHAPLQKVLHALLELLPEGYER
jgi:hypothetical protein